ncbi:MAG: DNA-protecting protein DprA [Patescibacteria group bacterium]
MDMRVIPIGSYVEEGIAALREIPEPPEQLWLRGTLPAPGVKRLAVVGSRALTSYGRQACETLVAGLAGYPVSIISGLALGADACAHRAALRAGLHTIAIPGSGLSERAIAPQTNLKLAKDILASGGALLSEHPPDTQAHPYFFPSRNRIMVGLADAVLVIEAGEKSGTLITARLAGEYGRDLLCVPHRMKDVHGFAATTFIRLGAALIAEPSHILEALGIPEREKGEAAELPPLSPDETLVYAILETPMKRDEAIRASGLQAGDALSALVMLELKGLAHEQLGCWRRV